MKSLKYKKRSNIKKGFKNCQLFEIRKVNCTNTVFRILVKVKLLFNRNDPNKMAIIIQYKLLYEVLLRIDCM